MTADRWSTPAISSGDNDQGGIRLVIYEIFGCATLALIAAFIYSRRVLAVSIDGSGASAETTTRLKEISGAISEGAMAFLSREYFYVAIVAVGFSLLMLVLLNTGTLPINEGLFSAGAFLAGAATSSLCAFMGMRIATLGNVRTTVMAQKSMSDAFRVAFNSGAVMGFGLVGLALFGLTGIYLLYTLFIPDVHLLMEMLAGFGLGGSMVALFGRVGGGIYTKAADVGADLVGKVEQGIPEDDPRNPAVIADNVGDNVGDIAGMGADLFGSCAEGTCAALLIGATASEIVAQQSALLYPILVTATGIPVCLLTAAFAGLDENATSAEPALKKQLLLSTGLMSVAISFVTQYAMVDSFMLGTKLVTRTGVLISVISGLWSGLLIGYVTEYYTSHAYKPVREVADASRTGPATNIIYGLALGYQSSF
ncbi:MAG TPA: sodium/proton-translocating pyrophosphatase, partial [Polyangiaceae bacterium]